MIQKNLTLIFISLFLSACSIGGISSSPPKWFLSIPKDSDFLYGNGNGKTLEESKKNAINDLASSIKLKVRSDTDILNTQNNKETNSKISQNIQISIEAIELQDISLTHNEYKNHQYYSQIKVSKNSLLKTLKNQYKDIYAQLNGLDSKKCVSISIKDKHTLENLLQQANSIAQSIHSLDFTSKLPSSEYYQRLLAQNSPLPKAHLIFSSNSDKEGIKILSSEYAKFIQNTNEKDIQTIDNDITIKSQNDKILALLRANIKDCSGKTIFYIEIEANEKTKSEALERIKVQLYKKLKEYQQGNTEEIPRIF